MGEIVQHHPRAAASAIERDLQHSLTLRRGAAGGTTLAEWLDALLSLGVSLDMPLASIEWGVSRYGNGRVTVDTSEDGLELREGTIRDGV